MTTSGENKINLFLFLKVLSHHLHCLRTPTFPATLYPKLGSIKAFPGSFYTSRQILATQCILDMILSSLKTLVCLGKEKGAGIRAQLARTHCLQSYRTGTSAIRVELHGGKASPSTDFTGFWIKPVRITWGGAKGNKNYLYNHQLFCWEVEKKNVNSTKLNTAESTQELCALSLEKKFAAY